MTDTTTAPAAPTTLGSQLTRSQRLGYVLLLGALVALGPFTVDMYLPAFPAVADALQTSDAAIQLTLTATTVGFGLGQLIVGPLSDAVGRKRPLIVATMVHVAASVGIIFAPTVEWIMAGRILQGIGAAGGAVVAMAIVRDLFAGQQLIRMLARLALVMGFAPVFAPVIGSQVLNLVQWRGIFVFLAGYGVLMTVLCAFFLRETLSDDRRGRFSGAVVRRRYRVLLTDPAFVGVAIVGAATFTSLFAYLQASSFILQDLFSLSPQEFGIVFGVNSVGLVLLNQLSARLMRRMPPRYVTALGLSVMTAGALGIVVAEWLDLGLIGVLVPMFFTVAPAGLVMPTVQVMALADHPKEAGTAASLVGAANMGVAGAVSPLVGVWGNTPVAMASVMLLALAVGQASLWLIVRRRVSADIVV